MGVKGLSTFILQNPDLSRPFTLKDSVVIFDGNNIIHALYFNYGVNFMYGGDYQKYGDDIRKYMSKFLECKISPIVIFDGGYEKSDKKLRTTIHRAKTRLTQVQYIVRHGCCSGNVLPILAYEVFYSVLKELGIKYAQCDYEADDQVTSLANFYKCPVISGDSDFFIFDIHNGFIHLSSIDMAVKTKKDSDGKGYKFLNCSIFYTDQLVAHFPGLSKSALPLFGTLMGNDYVQASEFDNFFSNIHLPKYKGKKLMVNSKQKKMMGLLSWLQRNSVEIAVDLVTTYLKKDRRELIKSIIEDSVNGYCHQNIQLSFLIDSNLSKFREELMLNSRLSTPCGSKLPLEFVIKFHQGVLPSFFINVIGMHRVFLQPQVETVNSDSSYACSLYIRQVLYGILIRHDRDGEECKSNSCHASIEEYDRQHNNLRKNLVTPLFHLNDFKMLPKLNALEFMNSDSFKSILLEVLGVKQDYFINVPDDWQLLLATINYWINNSVPYTSEACINALALVLIYFSLIKSNISYYKCNCLKHNKKNDLCDCLTIASLLSRIEKSNFQYASCNLEKYIKNPPINHGNPLILDIVHSYSQLQTCILYTIYLNKLLGNCLVNPSPEKCFCGTMLYNIAKDISSRPDPELFISEMLGRNSHLFLLFKQLCSKMCDNVPLHKICKSNFSQKNKKSKKNKDRSKDRIESAISNNPFDVLNLL